MCTPKVYNFWGAYHEMSVSFSYYIFVTTKSGQDVNVFAKFVLLYFNFRTF